jgi:sugar lactone lactonase YvrE
MKTLMSGIAFGESLRWHDGRVWFADWGAQEIVAVDPDGGSEVVVRVDFPSFPLSFDWLPDGRLLVVSATDGRLMRREADGSLAVHAELSGLAAAGHAWNELVVDGHGNAYVNNIGFNFAAGETGLGTIAMLRQDGQIREVADGLGFPNGMAVTPDNSTLIVGESYASKLTAFDIDADGSLSNRRTWADTPGDHPDGICIDAEGAVWYADVANSHCVRVREGGDVLQTVELDRGCFDCMLGGDDGQTLFIVGQEWHGPQSALNGDRTGRLVATPAPAPAAGTS